MADQLTGEWQPLLDVARVFAREHQGKIRQYQALASSEGWVVTGACGREGAWRLATGCMGLMQNARIHPPPPTPAWSELACFCAGIILVHTAPKLVHIQGREEGGQRLACLALPFGCFSMELGVPPISCEGGEDHPHTMSR